MTIFISIDVTVGSGSKVALPHLLFPPVSGLVEQLL